jgi:hypothetical protein
LHFGLGAATKVDTVQIRWPNGKVETIRDVPADFVYTVVEGEGIRERRSLPPPGTSK